MCLKSDINPLYCEMRTWVELCLFPQMSGALTAATSDCDLVRQEGLHQVSKGKPTLQLAPINTNGFFIKGNWDTAHSHTAHIHTHTHMYTCVCTHCTHEHESRKWDVPCLNQERLSANFQSQEQAASDSATQLLKELIHGYLYLRLLDYWCFILTDLLS